MSIDYSKATVSELQAESDRIEGAIGEAERVLQDFRSMFGQIRSELQRRLKPAPEPRVTDHALLRYIERVMEVDVEQLRENILTDNIKNALKAGATGVKVDGICFIAKEGVLVTVLDKTMRPKRKTKRGMVDFDDTQEQLAEMES